MKREVGTVLLLNLSKNSNYLHYHKNEANSKYFLWEKERIIKLEEETYQK